MRLPVLYNNGERRDGKMKDCMNRMLCDIVRLCKGYQEAGYATPDMRERTNIPVDLLVKGAMLSIPDSYINDWNATIKEIEEILADEHIEFVGECEELCRIAGYHMKKNSGDEGLKIGFPCWCVFIYTYVLDKYKKTEFLWRTILFPYIYLQNIFSSTTVNEEIENLLREYPIAEDENGILDILQTYNQEQGFQDVVESIDGINSLMPTNSEKGKILRMSRSGWENLIKGYKRLGENSEYK